MLINKIFNNKIYCDVYVLRWETFGIAKLTNDAFEKNTNVGQNNILYPC